MRIIILYIILRWGGTGKSQSQGAFWFQICPLRVTPLGGQPGGVSGATFFGSTGGPFPSTEWGEGGGGEPVFHCLPLLWSVLKGIPPFVSD